MKRLVLAVAIVLFGFSAPAFAWGPAGHKIVASIAFRQLTDAEQTKIIELLKEHPRFDVEFGNKLPTQSDGRR